MNKHKLTLISLPNITRAGGCLTTPNRHRADCTAQSAPPDELDLHGTMDLLGDQLVEKAPSAPPDELDLNGTTDLLGDQLVEEQSALSRAHCAERIEQSALSRAQ